MYFTTTSNKIMMIFSQFLRRGKLFDELHVLNLNIIISNTSVGCKGLTQ